MFIRLLIAAAIGAVLYQHFGTTAAPDLTAATEALPSMEFSPALRPGIDPIQTSAAGAPALRVSKYLITPVANFQVAGRVLGAKRYRTDREAELAPVDLAMGWGPMADPTILNSIDISQSGRFYYWRVNEFPIPRAAITEHSANMHLIPASPEVAAQVAAVEEGQKIRFKGYLVKIESDDGWRWKSSMTRKDHGAGACEVVLVDALETL